MVQNIGTVAAGVEHALNAANSMHAASMLTHIYLVQQLGVTLLLVILLETLIKARYSLHFAVALEACHSKSHGETQIRAQYQFHTLCDLTLTNQQSRCLQSFLAECALLSLAIVYTCSKGCAQTSKPLAIRGSQSQLAGSVVHSARKAQNQAANLSVSLSG